MEDLDEQWAALQLARALERYAHGDSEDEAQDAARRLHLPLVTVEIPGASPACYVPELYYPYEDPSGVIVVNNAYPTRQRARAIRHEIGHHLLWPASINEVFGRRFPLNPLEEAYLLRERIVRRAETIRRDRYCYKG